MKHRKSKTIKHKRRRQRGGGRWGEIFGFSKSTTLNDDGCNTGDVGPYNVKICARAHAVTEPEEEAAADNTDNADNNAISSLSGTSPTMQMGGRKRSSHKRSSHKRKRSSHKRKRSSRKRSSRKRSSHKRSSHKRKRSSHKRKRSKMRLHRGCGTKKSK